MFQYDPQYHSQTALVKYNQLMYNSCRHLLITDDVISERILIKYRTMLQVRFTVCRSYVSHCVSKIVMSFCLLNDY